MTKQEISHEADRIKREAKAQMLALLEQFKDCSFHSIPVGNFSVYALTRKNGELYITYKENYDKEIYTDTADTLSLDEIAALAYSMADKKERGLLRVQE